MGLFGESKQEIIQKYENKLREKDLEINNFKDKITELKNAIIEKESKIKELQNKYNEKERETEEKNEEVKQCKEKIIYYQKEMEKIKSELSKKNENQIEENLKYKILYLQNQLQELEDVKDKKSKLSEEVIYLQKELKNKNLQILNMSKNEGNEKYGEGIVLCAGKYKGGIGIPVGVYNLYILSGNGMVETNKPDDVWCNMSSDKKQRDQYNYTETYNGLEINEKTILKISNNAKIKFIQISEYGYTVEISESKEKYEKKKRELDAEYVEKYSEYCERYNKIKSEIEIVRGELRILNNKVIEKYYVFSDYDVITSEDCKNELILLRTEEKSLRESEQDIEILTKKINNKITERSIRQILRNFNSECDNITSNISLKNIDAVRAKIQRAFESLNKLYSFDGVNLSKKMLEIKLKRATLLYTFELKRQQEKDIQQAIKEQMMEEARAERELQEQKKKIDKDLQQHLGEVKRLMKYMQKTQADVERQMYMDKIKELEKKIKSLESDKETVLEREANAKAGFVYIISNIGSFGEDIYKIGMTRRLEPMDRVKELSSASVPFEFDVHAMIFSSDAPDLENTLHKHFADHAVNKVNPRKEFYKVYIDEIERVVKENYNDTVQFTKIPVAAEYRQSMEL